MKTKRGDIVLVLFPDSNNTTAKRRPAIVVQADKLPTQLSQVIIAMISSNMTWTGPSFRIPILKQSEFNHGTGLKADSVIMLDNLTTVLNQHVNRRIGSFSNMPLVNAALQTVLAI